jgi:hypothetical protein
MLNRLTLVSIVSVLASVPALANELPVRFSYQPISILKINSVEINAPGVTGSSGELRFNGTIKFHLTVEGNICVNDPNSVGVLQELTKPYRALTLVAGRKIIPNEGPIGCDDMSRPRELTIEEEVYEVEFRGEPLHLNYGLSVFEDYTAVRKVVQIREQGGKLVPIVSNEAPAKP